VKRLNAEGRDFATTGDQELLAILRGEIQKLSHADPFISNFISRRQHNAFIISSAGQVLEDCVLEIAQMVRAGLFRPKLSEVSFGRAKGSQDTLDKYELELGQGRVLSLDGKIDRLDVAQVDGRSASLVFDYKRSEHSARFDWAEFHHGLDLQLPIYMLAARGASGSDYKNVIGAFYMPIEVSPERMALVELPGKTERFSRKAKGLFDGTFFLSLDRTAESWWSRFYNFYVSSKDGQYGNYRNAGALRPDDFQCILKFAERKIVEMVQGMLSGRIEVKPYRLRQASPCSFCQYRSVCRFDWQINDYNLLEPVSKLQVLGGTGGTDG